MEQYAKTLIESYNASIVNFTQSARNNFYFYAKSYSITSYISSTFGVAIILSPNGTSFENKNVESRVEEAVFGGNISENWAAITVSPNIQDFYIEGSPEGSGGYYLNGHPFIELGNNSTGIIESLPIDSVIYPCVIMKANNESSHWNIEAANHDAKQIFEHDLVQALNNSEEVKELYAQPVLQILVETVVQKWQNALATHSGYSPVQKENDIQNIKDIAKNTYGISNSSGLIDSILEYVKGEELPLPPPPKTVFFIQVGDDKGNWLYVFGWCFLPFLAYSFFVAFRYLDKKYHPKDLKYWYGVITGAVISPCFGSLITNSPYDYSVLSLQTGVIILIISIGFSLFYLVKKNVEKLKLK